MCQTIIGTTIDAAIGDLLVEAVTPVALEMTLAVQHELERRVDEADRLRHRQVERAQYEADLARQRYMHVAPTNRLVADSLQADWNAKLRALDEAREDYERRRTADRLAVDDEARLASSHSPPTFPPSGVIWGHPRASASACSLS